MHGREILGHPNMDDSVMRAIDEYLRSGKKTATVICKRDQVKLYCSMGIIAVNGRPFKMLPCKLCVPEELFLEHLKKAEEFKVTKDDVFGYYMADVPACFGRMGRCTLCFSASEGQVQYTHWPMINSWLPGWRTLQDWIKLLQRRARRARRARRCLAAAMATHARLGERAPIAALGVDMIEKICLM